MKKIISSFNILLLVSLCLSSCDKFLDVEDVTRKTTGNFPATEKEADEVLTGIYAHMLFEDPETSSSLYLANIAGDECLGGNLSFSNNCATNFLMTSSSGAGLNILSGLWDRTYTLINRANSALQSFSNVEKWSSKEEENRHYGEAYFLRAVAYYELAQTFGEVPVRTTPSVDNIPRAPIDTVYYVIAEDLKKAIELMPAKNYFYGSDMTGHATKYAAEAYMARIFLFYTGRYGKETLPNGITKNQVITWIDDCVEHSGCDLVSDQRNIWAYTNPISEDNDQGLRYQYVIDNGLKWEGNSCKETLYANKHNLKSNWTYTWWSNTMAQFNSPSGDNQDKKQSYPFGTGWGAGPVSPAFVQEWEDWSAKQTYLDGYTEDPRLTGSVWSYAAYDPNVKGKLIFDRRLADDEPVYTVSYRYYEQTGYFNKKYINILAADPEGKGEILSFGKYMYPGVSIQTSQSLLQIQDYIFMRFADVLLMQSELKEDATGLNRVRRRSHLAPVAYSLQAIKDERRYELAFESIRWFDMLRWSGPSLNEAGKLLNKQTGFTLINAAVETPMVSYDYASRLKETQGYWAIPQTEIDLSNGVLKQNQGWSTAALFTDWTKM